MADSSVGAVAEHVLDQCPQLLTVKGILESDPFK